MMELVLEPSSGAIAAELADAGLQDKPVYVPVPGMEGSEQAAGGPFLVVGVVPAAGCGLLMTEDVSSVSFSSQRPTGAGFESRPMPKLPIWSLPTTALTTS
jgi:hypothetical protein